MSEEQQQQQQNISAILSGKLDSATKIIESDRARMLKAAEKLLRDEIAKIPDQDLVGVSTENPLLIEVVVNMEERGFASPEQLRKSLKSVVEDIYGPWHIKINTDSVSGNVVKLEITYKE